MISKPKTELHDHAVADEARLGVSRTMTPRHLDRRIEKLEQAIEHVADANFSWCGAKSDSEIRQAFREAHITGEIREGDPARAFYDKVDHIRR